MHVGLIGGIGPAATDFYYRGLIDRHVAAGIPLHCTIAHADVREMSRNLNYLIAFRASYTQRAQIRKDAAAAKMRVSAYILTKLGVRVPGSTKLGGAK